VNIHRFYAPFQTYFRTRRMRLFEEMFGPTSSTRIIDVGGYEHNWTLIDARPEILLVNLEDEDRRDGRFHKVRGDGRQLAYDDNSFDIAYSNSVIEHVGDSDDQGAFAAEIRRVASRYYVQTPNRWFLIEPHLIAVGIHYLPRQALRRLVRWLSVWGWVQKPDQAAIDALLASIRLLDKKRMRELFPDAEIQTETFLGMTKSIIAIRR
jgi:ubiquinone/menaquinone biosynthesis C-methylase UbiE